MGQLCCFPLSRPDDKLSVKKGPPPDDDELVSLSKRLVEDAVLRAVQQYMEETQQNGTPPKDDGPAGRADKQNSTKWPIEPRPVPWPDRAVSRDTPPPAGGRQTTADSRELSWFVQRVNRDEV